MCILLLAALCLNGYIVGHADEFPPELQGLLGSESSHSEAVTTQASADTLLPQLGHFVGLAPKHSVTVHSDSRDSLKATLIEILQKQYPGDLLDRQSQAYQRIGLIPVGADLRKEATGAFQGQIAGFYNQFSGRMVIIEGANAQQQIQVLRHELVHALQDQYFELAKIATAAVQNDDAALALQSVIEGQAVVASFESMGGSASAGPAAVVSEEEAASQLKAAGYNIKADELKFLTSGGSVGAHKLSLSSMMVPEHAPNTIPYLQAQMLFPYQEGTRFIEALNEQESFPELVSHTLSKPPSSTSEIMHPERYGKPYDAVSLRAVAEMPAWRPVYRTSVGELNIRTLLGATPAASDIASGWNGDLLLALRGTGNAYVVAWLSSWRSTDAANAFANALREVWRLHATDHATADMIKVQSKRVGVVAGATLTTDAGPIMTRMLQ